MIEIRKKAIKKFIDTTIAIYIVLSIKKALVKGDWINIKRKEYSDD